MKIIINIKNYIITHKLLSLKITILGICFILRLTFKIMVPNLVAHPDPVIETIADIFVLDALSTTILEETDEELWELIKDTQEPTATEQQIKDAIKERREQHIMIPKGFLIALGVISIISLFIVRG